MITPDNLPLRSAIRLDPAAREAIATIAGAITAPHRKPPTLTDAVKAAIIHAAAAIKATGTLQGDLRP